ncbi:MAG: hypothetical protein MUP19_04850, partial [Candidatus Aminicenantes bacterium]|nr:hypothetical protein [Candidatus Aminicenantes bacterium]
VYSKAIEDVRLAQKTWEQAAAERTATIDQFASDLYKKDPALACQFLTDYSLSNVDRVIQAWWELGDQLLVKYNHLWIYNTQTRKREPLKLPDWWLKLLAEYNKLQPQVQEKK